ncbi:probable peptide/nitrate transporter At3g43790 isoform X1 [Gossypium raimondii]|uniref:probable peptide/nitrate transporter At3g43790 isoform X1 n=1 Tax=Gossypium raimondii TaxID=29730 RepID=UPI00063AADED|nr:probable peptide/nitrate transporter At3g43790 isoform X1 [Gossypium raimondii]XP_012436724.1 probable peptide/nitrate transporter At3g43790 isoform X1 [Gossypium raimondii]XP_012436726.1 probable peptide/nitrate transporter At3g43790 isoform X1 [Gossypium raimondii]XP_012436727.1 probable peptide/nitrate transporter At3g43790 isoform X1 [Gossypium raimondii]XP_012436728.1 probable peptide/nitrate transporter At3g43790 isoform X1 [Gossypium raimondii]
MLVKFLLSLDLVFYCFNCCCIHQLRDALGLSWLHAFQLLSQRGAANAISITAMSVFKAFGPAGGGALFSWAQERQVASFLLGDQMVFFAPIMVQFIGLLLTFKPFLAEPYQRE